MADPTALREALLRLCADADAAPTALHRGWVTSASIRAALSATPAAGGGEGLTLSALRTANVTRQREWDRDDRITLVYRANELAGETGEACNVAKKLERERMGIRGSRDTVEHLAEELADVVICVDLVAMHEGIDLAAAVAAKFNATSEKNGLATRLPTVGVTMVSAAEMAPSEGRAACGEHYEGDTSPQYTCDDPAGHVGLHHSSHASWGWNGPFDADGKPDIAALCRECHFGFVPGPGKEQRPCRVCLGTGLRTGRAPAGERGAGTGRKGGA